MAKEITPEVQAILDSLEVDPFKFNKLGQEDMAEFDRILAKYRTAERYSKTACQNTDIQLEHIYNALENIVTALTLWPETEELEPILANCATNRACFIDLFTIKIAYFRQFTLKPK